MLAWPTYAKLFALPHFDRIPTSKEAAMNHSMQSLSLLKSYHVQPPAQFTMNGSGEDPKATSP
jgi:hypothetical protein